MPLLILGRVVLASRFTKLKSQYSNLVTPTISIWWLTEFVDWIYETDVN